MSRVYGGRQRHWRPLKVMKRQRCELLHEEGTRRVGGIGHWATEVDGGIGYWATEVDGGIGYWATETLEGTCWVRPRADGAGSRQAISSKSRDPTRSLERLCRPVSDSTINLCRPVSDSINTASALLVEKPAVLTFHHFQRPPTPLSPTINPAHFGDISC